MNATFYALSINLLVAPVKSIGLLVRYTNTLQKRVKYSWIPWNSVPICGEYFMLPYSYAKLFTQLLRDSMGGVFLSPTHRILRNLPIHPDVNIRTRLINKSPNQPLIVHRVWYTHWCLSSVSFSQSAAATANTISKLKVTSLHNKNLPKQLTCGC